MAVDGKDGLVGAEAELFTEKVGGGADGVEFVEAGLAGGDGAELVVDGGEGGDGGVLEVVWGWGEGDDAGFGGGREAALLEGGEVGEGGDEPDYVVGWWWWGGCGFGLGGGFGFGGGGGLFGGFGGLGFLGFLLFLLFLLWLGGFEGRRDLLEELKDLFTLEITLVEDWLGLATGDDNKGWELCDSEALNSISLLVPDLSKVNCVLEGQGQSLVHGRGGSLVGEENGLGGLIATGEVVVEVVGGDAGDFVGEVGDDSVDDSFGGTGAIVVCLVVSSGSIVRSSNWGS